MMLLADDWKGYGSWGERMRFRTGESIEVLFEDNHLLVVKKPVNMLTQRICKGHGYAYSFETGFKARYNKPGNVFGSGSQLDRPVGGIMVLPKHRKLHQGFRIRYEPDSSKKFIWR